MVLLASPILMNDLIGESICVPMRAALLPSRFSSPIQGPS
jgi:hypothetical protein